MEIEREEVVSLRLPPTINGRISVADKQRNTAKQQNSKTARLLSPPPLTNCPGAMPTAARKEEE